MEVDVGDAPVSRTRSALMARIRRANTKPELAIRRLLHRLGYRFRTQLRGVPGRPDIAFPARRKAIFIHGCFWHQHSGCRHARLPSTRSDFWAQKFQRNKERDARLLEEARRLGWDVLVTWECETVETDTVQERLITFLGPPRFEGRLRRSAAEGTAFP